MYTRCTISRPLTDAYQDMANNLEEKALLYISRTNLYGSPKSYLNSALRLFVYNIVTNWKVPQDLVQQVYVSKTAHECSPAGGEQSAVNAIFVHLLQEFVRLQKSDPNSALRPCVHKMCQTGRSRRTLYNRCTTPRPLTDVHKAMANKLQRKLFSYTSCTDVYDSQKSDTNSSIRLCVCTKHTKLEGPVVPCTPGVRLLDRSRMFTRPW